MEAKFFGPFRVLYFVKKQAYKLELPKKWKIYGVFHVSLLEQEITKKERVDNKVPELDASNEHSKEYKVETIWDNGVYAKKSKRHLPGFYYLVA